MSAIDSVIFNVLIYLAIFPGLWVAMRMEPVVIRSLKQTRLSALFSNRMARFFFWLALGYFFTLPLIDILYWIESWFGLFSTSGQSLTPTNFLLSSYFLGIILLAVVYGVVFYILRPFWNVPGAPFRIGRLLAVGGVASLIADIVRGSTIPFVFLQATLGQGGFFLGWVVALVVMVLIIALMNTERQLAEDDEN